MIRPATRADLPRILEIRDGAGENRFTDLDAMTEVDAGRFIDTGALWVWQEVDGLIAGFSAVGIQDSSVAALFVAAGYEGKGVGRALLDKACDALRVAGHWVATISTEAGSRAERHFRAAGWTVTVENGKGKRLFRKLL